MFKIILYIVVTLSLLICTCNSQENAPESQPQPQEQSPQQPQEQPIEQPQDSQNVEQPQTPQQPQDQQPQPQEQPQQQQEQPPQPQQQQPQEQPPQQPQQQQPSQQQQPQQSPQQQPPPQQSPQQQQQSPQQQQPSQQQQPQQSPQQQPSPQQSPQQQQSPQPSRPPPSNNNNNNNNGVILGACTWPPAQIAMGQSLCFEAPANHCKILEGEVKRLLNTTVNMNLPIDSPFLWEANAICPDRGSCCNNVDVCIMSSPYLCLIYNYLLRNRSPVSFNPKSNCMDCIGVEFNTAVKTDINICTLQGAICDSQNQAVKIQINTSLEEFFRISLDQILRINATLTARALEVLGKVITEKNGILNVENITIRGEFDVQGGKVSVGSTASAENATVNMDSGEIRFNSLKLQNSLVSVNSHSIFLVDNNLDVSGGNFNVGDGAITVKGSLSLSNSKIKMNEFSDFMTMCNSDIKNSNFEFDFNDVVNSVLKGKKNGNSTKTIFNNKNYNNNKACDVRVSNTNVRISRNSLPIGCDSNKSSLNTINNNLVATLVITCDDSAIVVNYVLRFILTTRTKKTETEISTAISQGLSKGTNTNINSFTVIVTSNNTNNNTGFMWNIRIVFTGSGYEQFALAKKFSDLISSFSTTSSPPPPTSSSPSSPPSSSFSSSSSSSSGSSGSVSGSSSASSAYYYAIQSLDATVDYTSMSMEENESKPKQPIDLLGVIIGCVVAALIVMVACAVFAQYSYRKGIAKAESNLISKSLKMNSSGGPKVY